MKERIRRGIEARQQDTDRGLFIATVAAVLYFAAMVTFGALDVARFFWAVRQTAMMVGPVVIVLGIAVVALGLIVDRASYSLLGSSCLVYGVGILLTRLPGGWGRETGLMLYFASGSMIVAVAGLVVQLRQCGR